MINATSKICTVCGEEKQTIEFAKGSKQCRECKKNYDHKYRNKNRELLREKKRRYAKEHSIVAVKRATTWRKNNTERSREICRKYRQNHLEKGKERQRRFILNNPEKIKEYSRKYKQKHPEAVYEYYVKYCVRRKEISHENVKKLTDGVVRRYLKRVGIHSPEPWLIEAKRQQILLNRKLKNNTKEALS